MRKENRTRTKVQEDAIVNYIKSSGYKNISDFASTVGMSRQNVWARIKGITNPNIEMLLKWSKVIDCDVVQLIALFYPMEWGEYKK